MKSLYALRQGVCVVVCLGSYRDARFREFADFVFRITGFPFRNRGLLADFDFFMLGLPEGASESRERLTGLQFFGLTIRNKIKNQSTGNKNF